jgi:hypothetical protein
MYDGFSDTSDDRRKQSILISESRGDLNWCTPCRGNPTNTPHAFHTQSAYDQTIRLSHGQCMATLCKVVNIFVQIHHPREEGLPTQSTARWSFDPRVHTQLLSHNSQWGSGEKTSFYWQPATRLTRPISPACDRYVQYLLTGANPSVLNRHGQRLQP